MPARARQPKQPPKRWLHGLCACCEDPSLSCAVCFCQCNAAGQVYQRATGSGCLAVAALMWFLFVATQAFSQSSNALAQQGTIFDAGPAAALGAVAGLLGTVASRTFFVRPRRAPARDAIRPRAAESFGRLLRLLLVRLLLPQLLRQDGHGRALRAVQRSHDHGVRRSRRYLIPS